MKIFKVCLRLLVGMGGGSEGSGRVGWSGRFVRLGRSA